ncbi:MAG: DNA phosphorothioation system sulfurtransferase DndC [Planctomycetota bacterium]|nr:DNA phosphorothioation system sulfurtransferase DndC [Planctomycetota bacterium]
MPAAPSPPERNHGARSAFNDEGFEAIIDQLEAEIQRLYLDDETPWIIGYSGGKDSTAVLQLVWSAISKLPGDQLQKKIHVISTDTLVENPVVSSWVAKSLKQMEKVAEEDDLPFRPHRLVPNVEDRFWVNLIGKGYPAPRHKFRWCTERLKITPSNGFILDVVKQNGEAILLLGARSQESAARAKVLKKNAKYRVRDRLSPSSSLPGCLIYTPVEVWSNDDVWFYLMQKPNPWGYNNRDLLGMYAGASADGECPLVVDDSTPSCGDSRFGCWVCTLVEKDKSMTAMVQNDTELEWMQPLLELRNLIDFREDGTAKNAATGETHEVHTKREAFQSPVGEALGKLLTKMSGRPIEELVRDRDWEKYLRDFRRLNSGNVQINIPKRKTDRKDDNNKPIMEPDLSVPLDEWRYIPGPYIQQARECWLRALLTAQTAVRELGPDAVSDLELITLEELEEVRRIWVVEKHEIEDRLPVIFEDVTGEPYPGKSLDDNLVMGDEEMEELSSICDRKDLHYQLTRDLLGLTIQNRNSARRAGIYEAIEKTIQRSFYDSRDQAIEWNRKRAFSKLTHGENPKEGEAFNELPEVAEQNELDFDQ